MSLSGQSLPKPPPVPALRSRWEQLITPAAALPRDEARQARLLLAMLTVLIPVSLFAAIYQTYDQLVAGSEFEPIGFAIAPVMSIAFIALYAVVRSGQYRRGATVFVLLPGVSISTLLLLFPPGNTNTFPLYSLVI